MPNQSQRNSGKFPNNRPHNPLINIPMAGWLVPLIILLMLLIVSLGAFGVVSLNWVTALGLNPLVLRSGDLLGLFTYAYIHSSWLGGIMNAALLMAFSGPMARAMGEGVWSGASFFTLFLLISVGAGLAFSSVYAGTNVTVVGASAGLSGIMATAVRLPNAFCNEGLITPLTSRFVLGVSALFALYHIVMALILRIDANMPIDMAWESHLVGYALGLILAEPWLRAFHPQYFRTAAR
jgi:membrane associated rhomboid family serine protease